MLCTAPLYHGAPFMFSMLCLVLGGKVVVMQRFDASEVLRLAERWDVSWLYLVPTMMHRICRLGEEVRKSYSLPNVRVVYHLGAPCPPKVKEEWIQWLGPDRVMELYAGAEAQAATVITGRDWLAHRGSVGQVRIGRMKVTDSDGCELAPGEIGEIWMRSEGEAATYRYLGASARERNGWESLGDMGWFDEEGYLYLADRQSDMVLVGGANVYPAEVEAALAEHPLVLSSCVIGLPDEEYGNRVHAIVQIDGEVSDYELHSHLEARLVPYKVPRSYERTSEPLRDDTGKVRRSELRQQRLHRYPTSP
jgi:bile acid-coenzyme A ligase